jgi:DNA-binding GntR family transcriptional regulator
VAAEYLEKEIIEGRLKPGERLIEQEWAAECGISRGSFREVLRILANAGLVEILPRRGARVATISREDVEEIYFLRKHLISIAAARAAETMTRARLVDFQKIVQRMEEAARRADLPAYFRHNVVFHETLLDAAGSGRLTELVHHLGRPTLRYRYLGLNLPGRMALSVKAHREMVSAFARGDGQRAAREIFVLIEEAGEAISKHLFAGDGGRAVAEEASGRAAALPATAERRSRWAGDSR